MLEIIKNKQMAIPRIFLSSTCYDLSEVRDSLHSFIENLGYIPVFSDKNDVFYHPDLHSHEACLKEIENCQIFILIIGGRFGGNYVYDTKRSIVNAEYQTAKKLDLPIFTFIKREVHEDHRVFVRNRKEKPKLYSEIDYPSIEKQETACKIFDFIDEVRKSDTNNAYFTFEYSRDISDILKKQFSGMFYDFLWQRKHSKEESRTLEFLSNISLLGKKTEEIIENIYKKVDKESADSEIKKLDNLLVANKFWYKILKIFNLDATDDEERIKELSIIDGDSTFYDYLGSKTNFSIQEFDGVDGKIEGLLHKNANKYLPIKSLGGTIDAHHKSQFEELTENFESFKSLNKIERKKLLMSLK